MVWRRDIFVLLSLGVLSVTMRSYQERPTPTYVLDLMTKRGDALPESRIPQEDRLSLPFGPRGITTDEPRQPQPLSVKLISLDRSQYEIGEPFIYELLITNNGDKPMPFPISTDAGSVRKTSPNAVGAFVGLTIQDAMLGLQPVGIQALYGAPDVPGSVIMLQQRETLSLRATGTWFLQSALATRPPATWSRNLEVQASLHLFASNPPPPLTSDNKVAVRLEKR